MRCPRGPWLVLGALLAASCSVPSTAGRAADAYWQGLSNTQRATVCQAWSQSSDDASRQAAVESLMPEVLKSPVTHGVPAPRMREALRTVLADRCAS